MTFNSRKAQSIDSATVGGSMTAQRRFCKVARSKTAPTEERLPVSNFERQRQIESDSVRDGCVRWCQNIEYRQAADTKPYPNLIGISLRSLADAIRAEQNILQTSKKALPAWGLPLLSIGHEQMALITLGTLFNMIGRSELKLAFNRASLQSPTTSASVRIE